jgi:hypothetical protein
MRAENFLSGKSWRDLGTGLVAEMGRLATVPIDFSPQRPV